MAQFVVMPKAGNSVESCILLSWSVAVGDVVEDATILCEAETDKSTIEVPAGVAGTVLALVADPGDEIPVMATIAVVGEPGESFQMPESAPPAESASPAPGSSGTAPPAPTAGAAAPDGPAPEQVSASEAGVAASPYARSLAEQRGVDWTQLPGSGPHGRVIARDIETAPETTRGAHDRPVPPGLPPGSGLGGRLTREDLADGAAATQPVLHGTGTAPDFPGTVRESTLSGVRKIVAERMMHSVATTATVTYTASAPANALLALRARFKTSDPALGLDRITLGDLVNFAAIRTASRHEMFSAHLQDGVLRVFEDVHLGMAVDTPRGLLVPTVRFAARLGLRELSAQTRTLVEQANAGSISPDLLSGATFTVSNLGALGIESFSPIINAPQTAILGIDAISPRAAAGADGALVLEQRIGFSLTADHRVIDGADAARFLRDLTALITAIDLAVVG